MDISRARALKSRIEGEIRQAGTAILDEYPLERYVGLIERYPKTVSYEYISRDVKSFCDGILKKSSGMVLELYHRALLLALMIKAIESDLGGMKLPEEIKGFYKINFERIMDDIEKSWDKTGFYLYPGDKFMKDLGVCSLCLIPTGAQKIDLSPIPITFLFKNGAAEFVSRLRYIISEVGGISPLFNQHTDSHDPHLMSHFNADGFRRTYMRFAEILKLNPEIKGVFGRTWFIDPQLEKVSPKLCYARHLNIQNGARLFHLEVTENGIKDAVYKSAKRRELYERGEYIPHDYLVIWPRKQLLAYEERQRSLSEEAVARFKNMYSRDS